MADRRPCCAVAVVSADEDCNASQSCTPFVLQGSATNGVSIVPNSPVTSILDKMFS